MQKNSAVAGGAGSSPQQTAVNVQTFFTGENIIDVITSPDVYNCYAGFAQISRGLVSVEGVGLKKRKSIIALQTVAIVQPGKIHGHQTVLTVLSVISGYEDASDAEKQPGASTLVPVS